MGLQFALFNPALALLLVTRYDADPTQVGVILAVYNSAGFLASLVIPAMADRRSEYLRPMLVCGVCTLALAAVLLQTTALPVAVVALAVLGAPAGVGNSLLFAHLKHSGSTATSGDQRSGLDVVRVALATVIITAFGDRAVLAVLAGVAAHRPGEAERAAQPGRRASRLPLGDPLVATPGAAYG